MKKNKILVYLSAILAISIIAGCSRGTETQDPETRPTPTPTPSIEERFGFENIKYVPSDIEPGETFPRFHFYPKDESISEEIKLYENLINDFLLERYYASEVPIEGRPHASILPVSSTQWREWNGLALNWIDTSKNRVGELSTNRTNLDINAEVKASIVRTLIDDEGYIWVSNPPNILIHFPPNYGWGMPNKIDNITIQTQSFQFATEGAPAASPIPNGIEVREQFTMENLVESKTPSSPPFDAFDEPHWFFEIEDKSKPGILISPEFELDSFHGPLLRIQHKVVGSPYNVDFYWQTDEDRDWSDERKINFDMVKRPDGDGYGAFYVYQELFKHENWGTDNTITRIKLEFNTEDEDAKAFGMNYIEMTYDTRKSVTNPKYILGAFRYYQWTGDESILTGNDFYGNSMIEKLRKATAYMQNQMGGLENNLIIVPFAGHDALGYDDSMGIETLADANEIGCLISGHGLPSNYWDITAFGHIDAYSTIYYYAALEAMAKIEQRFGDSSRALELRSHAEDVKATFEEVFWNEETGRFLGSIDVNGRAHDYGFTFLNLEAITYGLGTDEQRTMILDWLNGDRIVESDITTDWWNQTVGSTGEDIYEYEFAPRSNTLNNSIWSTGWGTHVRQFASYDTQVQNGGAIAYVSFYDIMARISHRGADDGFARFKGMMDWFKKVQYFGGYMEYYGPEGPGGAMGQILQGASAQGFGNVGIAAEFTETIMIPSVMLYGFMGVNPDMRSLNISPSIPSELEAMRIENVLYRGNLLDIKAYNDGKGLRIENKDARRPMDEISIKAGNLVPGEDYILEIRNRADNQTVSSINLTADENGEILINNDVPAEFILSVLKLQ